jgi:threonine aldolase
LQERVAEILGKEAALYVVSGHQGNQLCLRAHSQPGDALICHTYSHVLHYETGTPCAISGLQPRTMNTDSGFFDIDDISAQLLPRNIHHSRNRILSLENTHNRCGGAVWPLEQFKRVSDFGREQGLAVHLDGARIWNAAASSGVDVKEWASHVDTLSVCFSKGLGAPVGSALAGTREFVEECRFYRKMFGGQMRQAGVIAAGALYALENNRERIAEDHANAKLLERRLNQVPGLRVLPVQTNIVMVDIVPVGASLDSPETVQAEGGSRPAPTSLPAYDTAIRPGAQTVDGQRIPTAAEVLARLNEGVGGLPPVMCFAIAAQRIRLVTHLDVTTAQCEQACEAFERVMSAELVAV